MCGVAGIWRFNQRIKLDEIISFTDSMRHRGPDGSGYELLNDEHLAFGHRRLSILDLTEAGKQPMSYANGRYWITFNGEIYNFIEIKNELVTKGCHFVSDSDTEVVLAAYAEWGTACFDKFNGMWAIAIWDNETKELLICRDRFGVKPLHFCYVPGQVFAFASETIAFKYLAGFDRQYDENNLLRAIHNHNVLEPAGKTIYKHIGQLLPGTHLTITAKGIGQAITWWKTTEHIKPIQQSFDEQKQHFLSLLADACRLRLRSDVPVASALSGGVDSTAVYCMLNWVMNNDPSAAQRTAKDWQRAFSISFPGSTIDERKYIQSVLDQTQGIGIITEPTNQNIISELESSTKMSDLISGTPLSSLTYVYKSMHENGITVSMDGHGVDEYIYGYNSSVAKALLQAYICGDEQYAVVLVDTIINMNFEGEGAKIVERIKTQANVILNYKRSVKGKLRGIGEGLGFKSHPVYALPAIDAGKSFANRAFGIEQCRGVENYYQVNSNLGEQQLMEEFHYIDLPYNLRDFDRGAMQHQIEIRMPFMDYRLVTYTMSLPQKSKLNAGYTKHVLREALTGIMPEDIRTRKLKIGLGAPTKDWFNGPLSVYFLDLAKSTKKDTSFLKWNEILRDIENNCMNKTWTDQSARRYWGILNYLLLDL